MPRIGEQRLHGTAFSGGVKLVYAAERGEIGLNGLDRRAKGTEVLRRAVDSRLVGSNE
jgi:hypothetical protein